MSGVIAGRVLCQAQITATHRIACRLYCRVQLGRAVSFLASPKRTTTAVRSVGYKRLSCRASAATAEVEAPASPDLASSQVRVRFAPSPTGNLHVGGARTALFNWLYAKNVGGTMVLRIEDTDKARSTLESEEAVLRDLKWMGIEWHEGPDVGGPYGPYRQSERSALYMKYVQQLVDAGLAYPCFCTDEELEAMKKEAEEKKLPPIYRGKWARASAEEVEDMKSKGVPFCYRFRVPKDRVIKIKDVVRGDVSWNTDTLGDFVIMRSNGMPVYNFCVAIDDALMKITHVIRAEEHLPNTLRQYLIYQALGFPVPTFGHVSLILAPDKSKLSKRHGATSVGEFRDEGYLPAAMMNYLSLLGWNDGTEKELYTVDELTQVFSLERITKSAAVFDKVKLNWVNGQHLGQLPDEELVHKLGEEWVSCGMLQKSSSPFVSAAVGLVKGSMDRVSDARHQLAVLLSYPLEETLGNPAVADVVADNFAEVVQAVVEGYDSGALEAAVAQGGKAFQEWAKSVGKTQKRKGKRLFMPMRVALTGRWQGPEVGEILSLLALEDGDIAAGTLFVPLADRVERLRAWLAAQ